MWRQHGAELPSRSSRTARAGRVGHDRPTASRDGRLRTVCSRITYPFSLDDWQNVLSYLPWRWYLEEVTKFVPPCARAPVIVKGRWADSKGAGRGGEAGGGWVGRAASPAVRRSSNGKSVQQGSSRWHPEPNANELPLCSLHNKSVAIFHLV